MRRLVYVAIAVVLVLSPIAVAQAPPTAGPEHKRMSYFVGTWTFTGTAKDSPMGKGGPITLKETCELMEGGFALVCRSEGKGPMGPQRAVSIMSYDADKKAYSYTAAESNMPVFTATGQVKGPVWTWTVQSPMGGQTMTTRVTVTEKDAKSQDFVMESSMDGKTFTRLAEAKVTKNN
jgi:hypothetical protein